MYFDLYNTIFDQLHRVNKTLTLDLSEKKSNLELVFKNLTNERKTRDPKKMLLKEEVFTLARHIKALLCRSGRCMLKNAACGKPVLGPLIRKSHTEPSNYTFL